MFCGCLRSRYRRYRLRLWCRLRSRLWDLREVWFRITFLLWDFLIPLTLLELVIILVIPLSILPLVPKVIIICRPRQSLKLFLRLTKIFLMHIIVFDCMTVSLIFMGSKGRGQKIELNIYGKVCK